MALKELIFQIPRLLQTFGKFIQVKIVKDLKEGKPKYTTICFQNMRTIYIFKYYTKESISQVVSFEEIMKGTCIIKPLKENKNP